ncbi:MAG: hypothetical protein H6745_25095 [Deltaproteobacteria bacterium]|nr:hypothetical protein [Deltaproteobacteria bacterium]
MIALLTHLVLAQLGAATAPTGPGGVDVAALASCEDSLDVAIFQSPRRPDARAPMRVMIVSDQDLGAGVTVVEVAPDGAQREVAAEAFGGPPWGWVVIDAKPTVGTHRYALVAGGAVRACQDVEVRKSAGGGRAHTPGEAAWDDYIKWERDTENLYSLWVERLFLAPLEEDISWNPLHDVLRDPSRNLLYDHLGLDEDAGGKKGLKLAPDCADFPYFLRAYFAWKMGLPMAFRPCRRGNRERAPTCGDIVTNELTSDADTRVGAFKDFVRKLQGTVHSSSLRGVPEDEDSDFYPVKLNRRGLRPGTIYTDPYGHTMMVGRWYPQEAGKPGVLMAIDAQPDGTIGRRIFWKGSFMFPEDDALKGAGWKRFRPVRRARGGHEELGNEAIGESVDYGDFSVEQWSRGQEGFYELMDEVINPEPLPPELALMMTIDALEQQVARRVESIDTGEQYVRSHPGKPVKMPDGPAIFVTAGPWEDYSTPARDLRILIAIDTVKAFPDRVRRYPSRFELAAGADMDAVVAGLREKLAAETGRRSITYTRTDGSKQTLTLAEVMARSKALEMAYNPNDCVEWRWGAPEGSDEASTCKRRAPEGQRDKMEREYRGWFERRYRPVE